MGRKAALLAGALILLIGCLTAEKLTRVLEEFYFARFEQHVTLDIQKDLFTRILHLPRSFFDSNQTGYLQSRLSEEVDELRWFFSSTLVHIAGNFLRLIGGVIFLFYLEWKLALAVLVLLHTETDGLRGFNLIKKIQPSIIILDLGLPNLDGIEVCKLLRKIKKFQKVPILAFSGRNCSMETLISVGFNDFIPKPSGINVLVDAIMQWLA